MSRCSKCGEDAPCNCTVVDSAGNSVPGDGSAGNPYVVPADCGTFAVPPPTGGNDTTMIHGIRDDAGPGAELCFQDATYRVDNLGATVADQQWSLGPGTILQSFVAPGQTTFLVSGDRVEVHGGKLDRVILRLTGDEVSAHDIPVVDTATVQVAGTRIDVRRVNINGGLYGLSVEAGSIECYFEEIHVTNATTVLISEGGVYVVGATRCRFVNVTARSCAGHGWWVGDGCADIGLSQCESTDNGTSGTPSLGLGYSLNEITVMKLVECIASANWDSGFFTTGAVSIDITFVACSSYGNNLGLEPGGHGFEILGPHNKLVDCHAADQSGDAFGAGLGYYLGGASINAIGCVAVNNNGSGFRVFDASDVAIIGGSAYNNGQLGAGLGLSGVAVEGTSANVRVLGVRCTDNQGVPTQDAGVTTTGGVTQVLVAANDLGGNGVAGLVKAGGTISFSNLGVLGDTVTGSRGGNAALANLLTALDIMLIIDDNTVV